jgi:tRNA A-37 threonylcarbamoyl transferase component Bud32
MQDGSIADRKAAHLEAFSGTKLLICAWRFCVKARASWHSGSPLAAGESWNDSVDRHTVRQLADSAGGGVHGAGQPTRTPTSKLIVEPLTVAMKSNEPNEAERFHVGTTIAGRYLVERPIGEGTMGAVALARHVSLDERVAIKFVRPELRRDPSAITRLSREAKALARIKSDHVCRVLDVGVTLSVGPYMVLEYLEGTDLGTLLEKEGPLPAERAVECALQACEALTVAHTAGITHRDLRPRNLFLARHGQFETLKVLGFGITDDRAGSDHRSDIWSMGVVLHELVTGRGVFGAAAAGEAGDRDSGVPVVLLMDESVLPASLRSIIARCLERDPEQRYQSVEELAAALAPLATMRERFRGRSTGAFARKLVEEELALSKTQRIRLGAGAGGTPATPAEASLAVRTGLREVGAGIRELARAVPLASLYERPVWMYAAVALASALSVVLVTSLTGGVHWVTPPPLQVERVVETLRPTAEAPPASASNVAQTPSTPRRDGELDGVWATGGGEAAPRGLARPAPEAEPAAGHAGPVRTFVSGSDAAARPPQRKSRARHERAKTERRGHAAAPAPAEKASAARASRVRLVQDNLVTNRPAEREPPRTGDLPVRSDPAAAGRDGVSDQRGKPAPTKGAELPDWLEAIKQGSSGR